MIAVTAVLEKQQVDIPAWIGDLKSFHRWVEADDFPDTGRFCYLKGRVWVDMTVEEMNHNQLTQQTGADGYPEYTLTIR